MSPRSYHPCTGQWENYYQFLMQSYVWRMNPDCSGKKCLYRSCKKPHRLLPSGAQTSHTTHWHPACGGASRNPVHSPGSAASHSLRKHPGQAIEMPRWGNTETFSCIHFIQVLLMRSEKVMCCSRSVRRSEQLAGRKLESQQLPLPGHLQTQSAVGQEPTASPMPYYEALSEPPSTAAPASDLGWVLPIFFKYHYTKSGVDAAKTRADC